MDWQASEDTVPSGPISEADARLLRARPPASGAWRDGDPAGGRRFALLGAFRTENGESLPFARLAYETWGELNSDASNAVLILHARRTARRARRSPGSARRRSGMPRTCPQPRT